MEEETKTKEAQSFEEIEQEVQLDNNLEQQAAVDDHIEEIQQEGLEEKPAVRINRPWIDLDHTNLVRDFKNLFTKPFWIIMMLLLVLFLTLFLLLFFDFLKQDEYDRLIGYVATNHKAPDWYQGDLPPEAEELIRSYNEKVKQINNSRKLIQDDPRIASPIMGDFYPEELTNEDVLLILKNQDIGLVTRSGAVKTELMNLSGLNLSKISFAELNNFLQSDLRYTNFEGISQANLVFRGASAQFAQFVDAEIPQANFTRARIDSANFYNSIAPKSLFVEAVGKESLMSEADFSGSNFNEAIFKLADFSESILDGASAKYSNFEGASFRDASLINVDFRNAILRGVNFVNANLKRVDFTGAALEGANFEGADIEGAKFNNADLNQCNFRKVRNAERKQFESSKTRVGIRNIPDYVFPKQKSFKERFRPPSTPY